MPEIRFGYRDLQPVCPPLSPLFHSQLLIFWTRLAGGFFTGKYKSTDIPDSGRFSNTNQGQGSAYRARYFHNHYFRALQVVEPVAKKYSLTLIEIALRWAVHHSALKVKDGNDGIIIGISSLDQLNSNLDDLEKGPLPQEVVEKLDEAWEIVKPDCPKYIPSNPSYGFICADSTCESYWHLELKYTYDTTA